VHFKSGILETSSSEWPGGAFFRLVLHGGHTRRRAEISFNILMFQPFEAESHFLQSVPAKLPAPKNAPVVYKSGLRQVDKVASSHRQNSGSS
jgi:hypothetical protein